MPNEKKECEKGEVICGNMPLCAFMENVLLFKGVEKDQMDHLCRVGRFQCHGSTNQILKEGEPGECLYIILSGVVRVTTTICNQEIELSQLSRGAFFGEVSCLTGRPRTANVYAVTNVELISIAKKDLDLVLKTCPKVRKLMQVVMNGRVRDTIEKTRGR
jgi:CRP-like cAMP-binding protein